IRTNDIAQEERVGGSVLKTFLEGKNLSEDQLQRQLNISWSTTAHERIADADVWCDGDREKPGSSSRYRIDRRSHVGRESRQQGIREVRMIEDIEDFSTQLES